MLHQEYGAVENGLFTPSSILNYTYDKRDRQLTSADTINNTSSSYKYNAVGDVIYANEDGAITRTIYDDYERVVKEIPSDCYAATDDGLSSGADTYSADVGNRYAYDSTTGNLTWEKNTLDVLSEYTYYNTGVLESESFDIYRYEYNESGKISYIKIRNAANSNVYTVYAHYVYDGNDVEVHYGNGQTVYYSYDSNNNVTAQSYTGRNETTPVTQFTYTYNTDNELTSKTDCVNHRRTDYSGNTVSVYDISTNSDVLLYSYSNTEENTSTNSPATAEKNYAGNTLDVSYLENLNRYQLNNNDIFSVNSTYTDNQLTSTVINNPSNQAIVSKSYIYDNDNNVTGLTVNNTAISYEYDDKDRITEYHQGNDSVI